MTEEQYKAPSLAQSIIPVIVLIGFLGSSVFLFGDGSSSGPNQIALILAGMVAAMIGFRNGWSWDDLQEGMVHGVSLAMGAIFILLVVGSLIGTWILSGIVPTMIYYGLKILEPSFFFAATLVICALTALATGSSWTTVSTIGIALVGVASVMGLSLPITAGAIISGAYFGDKISPLSDTTNLAPAMAGTELFTHIRHMLWTTVPSFVISLVLYAILGFNIEVTTSPAVLDEMMASLHSQFNIGPHLLLVPLAIFFMIARKVPAFPALLIGSILGGVTAMIFQPEAVLAYVNEPDLARFPALVKGFWRVMFEPFTLNSGNEALDSLLSRGGMSSMLNTCWLIICAMMFGALMEKTGMLGCLADRILRSVESTGSLIAATIGTAIGCNVIASDQYIAIVLPGRMFRQEYEKRGLHPKNLSRALEDAGTLTSPLIPWNTCGAFMAGTLGVATFAYLPFCFLNILNPIISIIYGYIGFTIEKVEE